MKLFDIEVKNLKELEQTLTSYDVPRPYSVAVEALVFDSSSKWILMERGPGCRDEIGKLEGIGGRFEDDSNFKDALKREISEEVGDNAQINILDFFEVRRDTVEVPGSKTEKKHWIIVSFICVHKAGELKICEPTKNNGFFHVSIDEVDPSSLSSSAASALLSLRAAWSGVKEKISGELT
jgi:ADP-ribose pyrophosphatase YjhB (NUDIX family)